MSVPADGYSDAAAKPAIFGLSNGANTGVQGYSGAFGALPAAPVKTGVYGYAAQDASARGIYGKSTSGRGVQGEATSGMGVRGFATTGTAGSFGTANPLSGFAIQAIGRVKLDKSAGLATIASGTKSVVDARDRPRRHQRRRGDPPGFGRGTTTVHRCVVNATTNTFTIYLTANSTATVKVAWHVFG